MQYQSITVNAIYYSTLLRTRVVFVGGKRGNYPLTGLGLPPHWFENYLPNRGRVLSPPLV